MWRCAQFKVTMTYGKAGLYPLSDLWLGYFWDSTLFTCSHDAVRALSPRPVTPCVPCL